MNTVQSEEDVSRNFRILDGKQILISLVASIAGIVLIFYTFKTSESYKAEEFYMTILGCLLLAIFAFRRFWVLKDGIVLDLDTDSFVVPGGGLSANSFTDYFSINWIIQYFKRLEFKVSDIRSASIKRKTNSDSKGNVSVNYFVLVTGNFGAAKIRMSSQGKAEEVLSALTVANGMGNPVVLNR